MTDNEQTASASPPKPAKPKPPVHRIAVLVNVPAGHVLPHGQVVKDAFDVTVVAGARWHPDFTSPLITVKAYRFLPLGDAIGFSKETLAAFPIPEPVASLVPFNEQAPDAASAAVLAAMGLTVPTAPEPYEAFAIAPAVRRTLH